MKWRPTTAFLTGACVVLACVAATYFLQRFAQFAIRSPRPPAAASIDQPTIQRPPHKVQLPPERKSTPGVASQAVGGQPMRGSTPQESPSGYVAPGKDVAAGAALAPGFRGAPETDETALGAGGGFVGRTIIGRVSLIGTPPPEKTIVMTADATCATLHPTPVTTRHYVGTNGGLANVFVYVKVGLDDRGFPPPNLPVVLDQKGCLYEPYVFGIQVGQPLVIRNSDPTLHNVHAVPKVNAEFNKGQPVQGMKFSTRFTKPEIMAQFKCDVHPWMFAYANVIPHPFFDTSREDGSFHLRGLPPGRYVIEAVHHKAGTLAQTVDVTTNRVEPIFFQFEINKQ